MGQVAERIGIRATIVFGATMIGLGLAVSASGNLAAMLVGHAVLVGFLGNGALYPPLIVYVSRWFDRRRGTALALISSGQYIAGMGWPTLFEYGMRSSGTALRLGDDTVLLHGWQTTMLGFACLVVDRGADHRDVSETAPRRRSSANSRERGGAATYWGCGRTRCSR